MGVTGNRGITMLSKDRKLSGAARVLWTRRADALKAGTTLMVTKPDRDRWTDDELRVWRYAMAISRRMERLH